MKLASLAHGRDGRLVVVSRDLTRATDAFIVVPTLQQALDEWDRHGPALEALAEQLEHGSVPSFRFHEHACAAPLPRAFARRHAAAWPGHVRLLRQAEGAEAPSDSGTPLRHAASDGFLAPRATLPADPAASLDVSAGLAVITGDVAQGTAPAQAAGAVRLVTLVTEVIRRDRLKPDGLDLDGPLAAGFAASLGPVAVTPDELGPDWQDGMVQRPLCVTRNGALLGRPEAGSDLGSGFGELIAEAARLRPLGAGTIVSAGPVSNRGIDGGPGRSVAEGGAGFASLAEARAAEIVASGWARLPYLAPGDRLRVEVKDRGGHSVFGAIEHEVA
ncbi:fumarylacetoacetate hydrolase family protein [Methylobacterium sp. 4-46]|uniref:fumarylacetoacetate hydrolase family protein n=1 Tax=unclassified Methylobacterium TaxID=2615210 RepID=UPI000152D0CE|nr:MULTISPECIES: fumarylacetoacetate hydrolase family protein [Methylobacterium]ACA17154.1 fumarylacetoacetate hydrolase family protein [Methylobacterium sp. 4-46]WFT82838.1 fumarylacetoacetate hydrolase family protein [Methylobacterium nodulans]